MKYWKIFNERIKNMFIKPEVVSTPNYASAFIDLCLGNLTNAAISSAEKIISGNTEYSYIYARDILGWRFRLGEQAISQDVKYAYLYARYIIKGRFELGEEIISKSPEQSYKYAKHVLEGRFELGEMAIAKSAEFSHLYARDALLGRFKLGEETIMKYSFNAGTEYIAMIGNIKT